MSLPLPCTAVMAQSPDLQKQIQTLLSDLPERELQQLLTTLQPGIQSHTTADTATQVNLGNSKGYQVRVEGGIAYIGDQFNVDAAVLEAVLSKLLTDRQQYLMDSSPRNFYAEDFCSLMEWISSKTIKLENLKPCYFEKIEKAFLNPDPDLDMTDCETEALSLAFNFCCCYTKNQLPRSKKFMNYRKHDYLKTAKELIKASCKIRKGKISLSSLIGDLELSSLISFIEN